MVRLIPLAQVLTGVSIALLLYAKYGGSKWEHFNRSETDLNFWKARAAIFPVHTSKLLQPTKVPNVFHYVWCRDRMFTFQHYLGLLSVIRHMRPEVMYFHYVTLPRADEGMLYHTWFEELVSDFPFIVKIPWDNGTVCSQKKSGINIKKIADILSDHGGIVITEDIILTDTLDLNQNFVVRWDRRTNQGFIQSAGTHTRRIEKVFSTNLPKCPNVTMITEKTWFRPHTRIDTPNVTLEQISKDICMTINGMYYPRDFWERDDILGAYVRRIFYGDRQIRMPHKNPNVVVPNIAHIIWVGGGEMDFLFYISVLSIVYIQEVERLYIHGDMPPSGERWDRVKNIPQVVFRYRNFEGMQIYGTWVGDMFRKWQASHWSDVMRCDIMLKWGGIYIDTDAFFVKKFDENVMHYDMVSHYSFALRDPYPDTFVNGLMLAKPGAEFFVHFQKSMRYYLDSNWMYNGLLAPYKIMERYPYLVHIEPRIQVVCLDKKCHPTWLPYYKNFSMNHLTSGSLPDWQNDANVYHFCSNGCPDALNNETSLRRADRGDMFAQMGRYILSQADSLHVLD